MASAIKYGTVTRNTLAAAMGAIWNGGTMLIYDAAPPANPQTAYTGNLLATINIPNPAFGSPSTGVISKAGTWSATVAASGTAAGFRMISSDGTQKMDGSAGEAGATPDAVLDESTLVSGGTVTVNSFTQTQPE